jgi:hypothetical protein
MSNTFRMYRKPGPPGEFFGYAVIDGVTYKIAARSVPDTRPRALKRSRCYKGTLERHLKADQQSLPLGATRGGHKAAQVSAPAAAAAAPEYYDDLNDELPPF